MVRLVERLVNQYTDVIVANSEAVRQDAIRQEGLPPDKVVVIHNGLDVPRFAVKPRADLRAGLGVRDGVPVIGVVANFIHYKGYEFFLEAWRMIRTRTPDAVGLLVGDGPMRAPMERRAAEMGLADSLRFVGLRTDIPDLLALMDVVVHPSLEEGFSNAVLEAMAAGRALVVTAVGGNPEAVTDEVTGVLVPPRDPAALAGAVLRLLADPAARVRLGDAARRRVASDFTLDAMVRQYEALYQRLIDRPSGRSAPSGANTPPRKERPAAR
jgi:glycosyltransferase involved in cell wall biosynthesis